MTHGAAHDPGHGSGHDFDEEYWERRWQDRAGVGSMGGNPPHPHLAEEVGGLVPGTALDAGCGAGAEALWLAAHGWRVTAADISAEALARAADRAAASEGAEQVRWVQADLSAWDPGTRFDLVMTSYAHPAMPQLEFYDRIAGWVAAGGTLLIVGHLHISGGSDGGSRHEHEHEHGHGHAHGPAHQPPAEASATAASVAARLPAPEWDVVTADERRRTLTGPGGRETSLSDVVVRATRRR